MEEKMMKFEPLQFTPPPPTNPTPSLSNFCTKEQKCTLLSGSQYTQGAKPARRGKWCNKLPQFSVRVNNMKFEPLRFTPPPPRPILLLFLYSRVKTYLPIRISRHLGSQTGGGGKGYNDYLTESTMLLLSSL